MDYDTINERLATIEYELERLGRQVARIESQIAQQEERSLERSLQALEWRKTAVQKVALVFLALFVIVACIVLNKLVALIGEDLGDLLETIVNAGSALTLIWALLSQKALGRQVEKVVSRQTEKRNSKT